MQRRATCANVVSVWNCSMKDKPRVVSRYPTLPRPQQEQEHGSQGVLGVEPDRFDHEVELVGAVDLACYRVGHSGPEEQGFGEVIEPVNALRVEGPQTQHRILL